MRKIKKMAARSILLYIEELKEKALDASFIEAANINNMIIDLIKAIRDL